MSIMLSALQERPTGPLVSRSGSTWASSARKSYRTRDGVDPEAVLAAEAAVAAVAVQVAVAAQVAEAAAEVVEAVAAEVAVVVQVVAAPVRRHQPQLPHRQRHPLLHQPLLRVPVRMQAVS